MEKSHLWETVAALDATDWRAIDKFVRSSAFNRREHVARLWALLHRCLREGGPAPGFAQAFAAAFPEQTRYDVAALRNSMTLLLTVVEEYLVVRALRRDEPRRLLILARTWRTLGLSRQFARTVRQLAAGHAGAPYRHADHYHFTYQLEQERYYHESAQTRMTGLNLQAVSDNLDYFYLAQKLRQVCFALAHQAVVPTDYDLGLWHEAQQALDSGRYAHVPAIAVYHACFRALTEPAGDEPFQVFKRLLLEHATVFPAGEQRDLFLLATNYCIRRLNTGVRAYAREALELYRESLRDDTILLHGAMSRYTFRNIVTMAIAEKQLDWADEFVHRYRHTLEPQHREPAFAFNLARLEYERGRFERALPLLQNAEYSDPLLHLSAKTLLIKVFYEIDQYDALHAQLDALQNFLRRHKELGYQRENYRQLIRYLKKIMNLAPDEKVRRVSLFREIEQIPAVAERDWLLGRIGSG